MKRLQPYPWATPDTIWNALPFGQGVAVVELTACEPTFFFKTDWLGQESIFGDFSLGRYAWRLENVRAIEPFPVKGQQGLFEVEVPDELIMVAP